MPTLSDISDAIRGVGERLNQQMAANSWSTSTPFSQVLGGVGVPISVDTLVAYGNMVAVRIERLTKAQLDTDNLSTWLAVIIPQLDALQFTNLNGQQYEVNNALALFQMIDGAIPNLPPREPKVNWEDLKGQKSLMPRDLSARLRSVDARLTELEPRSKEVAKKIADIEEAHAAADQLPTDLAELADKRNELGKLIEEAKGLADQIAADSTAVKAAKTELDESIDEADKRIKSTTDDADALLAKSEYALRGATAVGLSKAFEARKVALSKAGTWWIVGLAVALCVALLIGWERVTTLRDILNGDKSSTVIIVNAMLTVLGVGAPVWFAWLSTKQIGTTFRLAEDYAFKASVAQAYEGYRNEAVNIDEQMRTRLFGAALDRFEEAPIRLVDAHYHSSPLQEILQNPSLRSALDKVPNLAERLAALVQEKAGAISGSSVASAVVERAPRGSKKPAEE